MKRLAIIGLCLCMAAMARGPSEPFDPNNLPPAPDYSKADSWAAWPGSNGPAQRVPQGEQAVPEQARQADVFFIHPTTDFTGESWNADIHKVRTNNITDAGTMAGQAAAFNKCCRIYAPRYRQMTLAGFTKDTPDSVTSAALSVAYSDVRRAFRAFLAKTNPKRPLILAGHSQGTNHLVRLLQDEVIGKKIMNRLVAVYAIGNRIPQPIMDGPLKKLALCEMSAQTGCLISWDSFEAGSSPNQHPPTVGHWDGKRYRHYPTPLNTVCINPLSWRQDSKPAPRKLHKGAVREKQNLLRPTSGGDGSAALPAPLRHHISAQCQQGGNVNGLMISNERDRSLKPSRLMAQGGSLHILDYALFFIDIRENADQRVKAFLQRR